MHPVLLRFGEFRVFSFGILVAIGGILSCLIWYAKREKMGLKSEDDFWLFINVFLLSGYLGGRLLFIIEYVPFRFSAVWSALFTLTQGFSLLGGFPAVFAGLWLLARRRRLPFLMLLDHVGAVVPFWHAFARLGCFAAGCCFGRPTGLSWAVRFTDPACLVDRSLIGVPLHPTQLYEAFGESVIFLVLYFMILPRTEDSRLPGGLVGGLYLSAYGVLRFGIEFLRGDTVPGVLRMTGGQALSLGLICAGLAMIAWASRKPACTPS